MTATLHLRAEHPGDLQRAAEILRGGGLVAFPTETVYGLGANALSAEAILRIFDAKGRPPWDPLIVHLAQFEQLAELAHIPEEIEEQVRALAGAFWPGPLTLLLPRVAAVPNAVTAGRPLVGLRVPAHPVAQALLRAAGLPIAAPSANRFGHVSPTTARHVLDDLDGRIDAVLDGGAASVGVESTVLDPAPTPMVIYRAGAVTAETIARVTGVEVQLFHAVPHGGELADPPSLPSPGVGLRHYAPEMTLVLSGPTQDALQAAGDLMRSRGERVCVLLPADWLLNEGAGMQTLAWGRWAEPESLAAGLFGALRSAEQTRATVILCPLPEVGGLRDALRDRLLKAAKPQ